MKLVLIVEDSSTVREMVAFVLKGENIKTVEAEDGVIALDLAKKHNFDLIITDHNMPNMLGIDLAYDRVGPKTKKTREGNWRDGVDS